MRATSTIIFSIRHYSDEFLTTPINQQIPPDARSVVIRHVFQSIQHERPSSNNKRNAIPVVQPSDIVAIFIPQALNASVRFLFIFRFLSGTGVRSRFLAAIQNSTVLERNKTSGLDIDSPNVSLLLCFRKVRVQWTFES